LPGGTEEDLENPRTVCVLNEIELDTAQTMLFDFVGCVLDLTFWIISSNLVKI
jgi:hypothetical protein